MLKHKAMRLLGGVVAAVAALGMAVSAQAQEKKIKIGVIYDLTGPLAGGGSELQYVGAKIMIDNFIKQGGVEGYKIDAIYADAQSKPDVAINEAVRLVEQEKVDMLLGFYSSAQCVPVAGRVEQLKKFKNLHRGAAKGDEKGAKMVQMATLFIEDEQEMKNVVGYILTLNPPSEEMVKKAADDLFKEKAAKGK